MADSAVHGVVYEDDVEGSEQLGFRRKTENSDDSAAGKLNVSFRTKSEVDVLDDGLRWRKYDQNIVKRSPHPRSYYQCSYAGCTVVKSVQRDSDDPAFVITTYTGEHTHDVVTPRAKTIDHHGTTGPETTGDSFSTGSNYSGITSLDNSSVRNLLSNSSRIVSSKSGSAIEEEEHGNNVVFPSLYREKDITSRTKIKDNDGYNWRKYHQKAIKGTAFPRSYYRCTYAGCSAKKDVERDLENPDYVITSYKGVHNHDFATPRAKSISHVTSEPLTIGDSLCTRSDITSLDLRGGANRPSDSLRIGSSKGDGIVEEEAHSNNNGKFSKCKREKDKVITHRTKSNVDVVDDGYRWRKYGQKAVSGSAYWRGYYKCTHRGCPARKTIQTDSDDPAFVITKVRNDHSHAAVNNTLDAAARPDFSPSGEYETRSLDLGLGKSSAAETGHEGNVNAMYMKSHPKTDDVGFGMDFSANDGYSSFDNPFPGYWNNDETLSTLWSPFESGFAYSGMAPIINFGVETSVTAKALPPPPSSYSPRSGSDAIILGLRVGLSSSAENLCNGKQEAEKVEGTTLAVAESKWSQLQKNSISMEEVYLPIYLPRSPSLSYLCAHNLISIFLPHCNVQQLWKGGEQLLVNLKSLDVNRSSLLWIPDLSMAQKLESLNLEGCLNLVGVSSIQHLTSLQNLNLKRCRRLKGLPSLVKLKLLKTLDLSLCSNLRKLPPSLGCLSSLSELNLRNCVKLEILPRSVVKLAISLETLNVSGCSSLWNSIGEHGDPALPLPLENLPSTSSISINQDANLEPQPIETLQVDAAAGKCASNEDSPSQELPLDLCDIWRKKPPLESDDVGAFMTTPLIDLLPSGSRIREWLLPSMDSSSNACSSPSEDTVFQGRNVGSDDEKSIIMEAVRQEQDEQQLAGNVKHEDDPENVGKSPQNVGAEFICHQVEDYDVNPSSEKRSSTFVGKVMQRFCQQCSKYHVLREFDENEATCRSTLSGNHHLKNKRPNECSIDTAESEEKHMVVLKRTRTSYDDTVKTDLAMHSLESLEEYLTMSLEEGLENANALSNIESALRAMIEHYSSSRSNKATAEESMLAELKRSVVDSMTSMQKAKFESAIVAGKMTELDADLGRGQLRLSMLDAEMSLIFEEEENIEAEIQRLMEKKREFLLV
ncbi:Probable WRKY transcription factor 20 [Linum grandiflorum]